MVKQPRIASTRNQIPTVLSVSPIAEDHFSLKAIIGHSGGSLLTADKLSTAKAILQKHDVSVILCERDLMPGTWIDMLEHTTTLLHAPSVIVTSKLADDRLWAEVLNLGCFDLLAKPFDHNEVTRSVNLASERWHRQVQLAARPAKVLKAAS